MSGRGGGGKRGERERGEGGREEKITVNVLYIGGRGEGRDRERGCTGMEGIEREMCRREESA